MGLPGGRKLLPVACRARANAGSMVGKSPAPGDQVDLETAPGLSGWRFGPGFDGCGGSLIHLSAFRCSAPDFAVCDGFVNCAPIPLTVWRTKGSCGGLRCIWRFACRRYGGGSWFSALGAGAGQPWFAFLCSGGGHYFTEALCGYPESPAGVDGDSGAAGG